MEKCSAPSTAMQRFFFQQTTAIPAYLIALAVGDLHSKNIGKRSCVWSEKELLRESAWEFADTELFIQTAEQLVKNTDIFTFSLLSNYRLDHTFGSDMTC